MTTMAHPEAAALLASPVRRALVEELARHGRESSGTPGMTAAELAPGAGLHVTTVRFHLDQLVQAGLVAAEFERQPTAGRPRKLYRYVAPAPDDSASTPVMLLATLLTEAMTAAVEGHQESPDEAGARWSREHLPTDPARRPADSPGSWLGRVGEVVDVLDRWGYHPDVTTTDGGRAAEIELTDCPFFDLARANVAVVCGVHHGLIAGALRQFGEPGTEVTLEPFVTPHRCVAHLRRTEPFPPAPEASSADLTRGSS